MKQILIIEDDITLLKGLEISLEGESYNIITETDGEKGYILARKVNPDLLLLDLNLPTKNGFEICESLKREGKNFPIFMLTNLSEKENKLRGLSLGADDYIAKPFDTQELLYRVRNALLHSERLKLKEKEFENELIRAQKIQLESLPYTKPCFPGIDVDGKTIPCQFIGGDYFDYIKLNDGRIGIVVADVSGKGMSAALTVNKMQGIMQVIKDKVNSAEELLMSFQYYLTPIIDDSFFVTAIAALFDIQNKNVQIARAGHLPVLLKRNHELKKIAPEGIFIGESADKFFRLHLKQKKYEIIPGDTFLFFTDGIVDCRNETSERFGLERLSSFLSESGMSATEFLLKFFNEIESFRGSNIQTDDMTLVIAKII